MRDKKLSWLVAALGAGLCAALFTARAQRRAVIENPPRGAFLQIGDAQLHFTDTGTGDVVVLLHGNGVSHGDFVASGLIARLATSHRVIAFDRPGFGHSVRTDNREWTLHVQAALLLAALERLGISKAVLVGHSMGATIAAAMALEAPTLVSKLVLISGYYYPTARLDAALVAPLRWPILGNALLYGGASIATRSCLTRIAKAMFAPNRLPAQFLPSVGPALMVRPTQIRASAQDAGDMRGAAARMEQRYAELAMPVTIFAGAVDPIVDPEDHSVRLHGEVMHSVLKLQRSEGHMLHHDSMMELADAITSA